MEEFDSSSPHWAAITLKQLNDSHMMFKYYQSMLQSTSATKTDRSGSTPSIK
jgi:hypothetical protein